MALLVVAAGIVTALQGVNSASAAEITDIRVGLHQGFTRVVVETDVAVPHEIERKSPDEIILHLPAQSAARQLGGKGSLLDAVEIDSSARGSAVHLTLQKDSVEFIERVFQDPPRIVLDLRVGSSLAAPEVSNPPVVIAKDDVSPAKGSAMDDVSPAKGSEAGTSDRGTDSFDAELAFHRGVANYGEGRLDEARAEFARVVAADPEDEIALHYLGLTAQAQGDYEAARSYFERSLAIDADNTDLKFDLGTALLELGEVARARDLFDEILVAQPQRARAHLYAGIADYRLQNYSESLDHLERAEELDPQLKRETRYYVGLSYSFLGRYSLASGAFDGVAEQSPQSPLGRSAVDLRAKTQTAAPRNPWALGFTSGAEWDTNPLVIGKSFPSPAVQTERRKNDWRGIFRAQASYRFLDSERLSLAAGYDGFLSLHDHSSQVDMQTHLGWASISSFLDPVLMDLRYDYSYTFLDLSDDFLSLHRVTPSLSMNTGNWGITQLVYQFQYKNFFNDSFDLPRLASGDFGSASDRDGDQHSVGINQFILVWERLDPLWIGALGDWNDARDSEFKYAGFEFAGGATLQPLRELVPQLTLSFDYRYIHRNYTGDSSIEPKEREDRIHRVTWSLAYEIQENVELSFAGSYTRNDSNIGVYKYDRTILGTYLSLAF